MSRHLTSMRDGIIIPALVSAMVLLSCTCKRVQSPIQCRGSLNSSGKRETLCNIGYRAGKRRPVSGSSQGKAQRFLTTDQSLSHDGGKRFMYVLWVLRQCMPF